MRAISLWQPWASAVALNVKRIETRHWSTNYTGPLVIHAAKRWTRAEREFAEIEHTLGRLPPRLPLGALVATCTLMGCRRTEDVSRQLGSIERMYGDYHPGRFAWFLTDIMPFPEPIPYRGCQGFFNVPDGVLLKAEPEHQAQMKWAREVVSGVVIPEVTAFDGGVEHGS